MQTNIVQAPTTVLFARAHAALLSGHWTTARRQLDLLSDRADNRDLLPDAAAYGAPAHLEAALQDRINVINRKAGGL